MNKRRVVVTGLGIVSPFGCGVDTFWNSLIEGKSGIKTITRMPLEGHLVTFGGEATTFEDEVKEKGLLDSKEMRRMDRFTQFACVASDEAVKDSGLDMTKEDPYRVGVIMGSGAGGFDTFEKQHKIIIDRGPTKCSPFTIPMLILNMAAGRVSMRHGAKGLNKAVVSACATSAHCVGDAFRSIQFDDADVVIGEGFFQWTPWAIMRARKTRLPFALAYEKTEHTERNCPWWRRVYRMFINKLVDLYLVNGSLSRQYLRKVIHANQPIIEGVMAADSQNMGSRVQRSKKQGNSIDGLVYLFVGRLIKLKGVDHLIRAWSKHIMVNPKDILYIVGDGPEMVLLKTISQNTPSIHFEGHVDYDSIHNYYARADVFVIPTLEDNWSLVVPEAMACGLPIATSVYNGCHPELVKEGINGITFDPLEEGSLLSALAFFHGKNLADMGKASREIEKAYSPEKCANRVFLALEDLVKNGHTNK